MIYGETKKNDWKLFQQKIGDWQERYMQKLLIEYTKLLSTALPASERFWLLDEQIKKDKRNPGIQMKLDKNDMPLDLARLIKLKIVSFNDLDGFSPELVEYLHEILER